MSLSSSSLVAHESQRYVGLKLDSFVAKQGEAIPLSVRVVDLLGHKVEGAPAPRIEVFRREGKRHTENDRFVWRETDVPVAGATCELKADVSGDEATLLFVMHTAGCEANDLPIVFVGSKCVGAYPAVVAADVSGKLASLLVSG